MRSDAREEFVAKFARRSIMKAFASDILRLMRSVTP
jgi:hypothetical protein